MNLRKIYIIHTHTIYQDLLSASRKQKFKPDRNRQYEPRDIAHLASHRHVLLSSKTYGSTDRKISITYTCTYKM